MTKIIGLLGCVLTLLPPAPRAQAATATPDAPRVMQMGIMPAGRQTELVGTPPMPETALVPVRLELGPVQAAARALTGIGAALPDIRFDRQALWEQVLGAVSSECKLQTGFTRGLRVEFTGPRGVRLTARDQAGRPLKVRRAGGQRFEILPSGPTEVVWKAAGRRGYRALGHGVLRALRLPGKSSYAAGAFVEESSRLDFSARLVGEVACGAETTAGVLQEVRLEAPQWFTGPRRDSIRQGLRDWLDRRYTEPANGKGNEPNAGRVRLQEAEGTDPSVVWVRLQFR